MTGEKETYQLAAQTPGDTLMSVEQHRAIQEVQASMIIAKKFPRDQDAAYLRIMRACERYSLADQAEYAYPRGDKTVTGASIRLAEVIAQNWGNLQFGIRELSQSKGESEIEAFAWDIETNTRQIKTFKVPHKRYTRASGNVELTDPRDIYEYTANQGARRMRACILGIIPGDIIEAAQAKCRQTLKKGVESKPLADQIRVALKGFDTLGVTKNMIEKRLGRGTDTITVEDLVELNNIGRSLKDNMTSREDWFEMGPKKTINLGREQSKEKVDYTATELKDEEQPEGKDEIETKDTPEDSGKLAFRKEWRHLRPASYSAYVSNPNNTARIEGACKQWPDIATEMEEKWATLCPNEPWPLVLGKEEPPDTLNGIQEENTQEIIETDANPELEKFVSQVTDYLNSGVPEAELKVILKQVRTKKAEDVPPEKRGYVIDQLDMRLKKNNK